MDDGGGNPGAVAAIAGIDICSLFAPFMFQIDVNIGRFVARLGQETGKEQLSRTGSIGVMPRK
jgi:hypothetical protein